MRRTRAVHTMCHGAGCILRYYLLICVYYHQYHVKYIYYIIYDVLAFGKYARNGCGSPILQSAARMATAEYKEKKIKYKRRKLRISNDAMSSNTSLSSICSPATYKLTLLIMAKSYNDTFVMDIWPRRTEWRVRICPTHRSDGGYWRHWKAHFLAAPAAPDSWVVIHRDLYVYLHANDKSSNLPLEPMQIRMRDGQRRKKYGRNIIKDHCD